MFCAIHGLKKRRPIHPSLGTSSASFLDIIIILMRFPLLSTVAGARPINPNSPSNSAKYGEIVHEI